MSARRVGVVAILIMAGIGLSGCDNGGAQPSPQPGPTGSVLA